MGRTHLYIYIGMTVIIFVPIFNVIDIGVHMEGVVDSPSHMPPIISI